MILKTQKGEYVDFSDVSFIYVNPVDTEEGRGELLFSISAHLKSSNNDIEIVLCKNKEIAQKALDDMMLRACELLDHRLVDIGEYV